MVRAAKDWPWSSYRATAGQVEPPAYLHCDWVLSNFGKKKAEAVERYRRFVAEGRGQSSPWVSLRNQLFLGSDSFVERIQSTIDGEKELSEIPLSQRRPLPRKLSEYQKIAKDRNTAITNAYKSGGYTLKEIGEHFGLHYSTQVGLLAIINQRPDPYPLRNTRNQVDLCQNSDHFFHQQQPKIVNLLIPYRVSIHLPFWWRNIIGKLVEPPDL